MTGDRPDQDRGNASTGRDVLESGGPERRGNRRVLLVSAVIATVVAAEIGLSHWTKEPAPASRARTILQGVSATGWDCLREVNPTGPTALGDRVMTAIPDSIVKAMACWQQARATEVAAVPPRVLPELLTALAKPAVSPTPTPSPSSSGCWAPLAPPNPVSIVAWTAGGQSWLLHLPATSCGGYRPDVTAALTAVRSTVRRNTPANVTSAWVPRLTPAPGSREVYTQGAGPSDPITPLGFVSRHGSGTSTTVTGGQGIQAAVECSTPDWAAGVTLTDPTGAPIASTGDCLPNVISVVYLPPSAVTGGFTVDAPAGASWAVQEILGPATLSLHPPGTAPVLPTAATTTTGPAPQAQATPDCPSDLQAVTPRDAPDAMTAVRAYATAADPALVPTDLRLDSAVLATDDPHGYGGQVATHCGRQVAAHTLVITTTRTDLLPSASLSEGVYFVSRSHDIWIAWQQAH